VRLRLWLQLLRARLLLHMLLLRRLAVVVVAWARLLPWLLPWLLAAILSTVGAWPITVSGTGGQRFASLNVNEYARLSARSA